MKLNFNSKNFRQEFLDPIKDVNKGGKTPIFTEGNKIYSISAYDQNSVFLYNTYKPVSISDPRPRFNINLERLKKALMCIPEDKQFIEVSIEDNKLSYKDDRLSANICLIEDQIVIVPKFNLDTFKNCPFDFKVKIPQEKIKEIKLCMDFANETSKFYITNNKGKLMLVFGDKLTKHNDDITVFLSDKFEGNLNENVYDITILRLTTQFKSDILMNIADNGALWMKINLDNSELNYITTQLKK